jgi:hypothetical protein
MPKVSYEAAGKRISGEYVVRDGLITVTASDGRSMRGMIEDCMLSQETLAKTMLLLQLQWHEGMTDKARPATAHAAAVSTIRLHGYGFATAACKAMATCCG